MSEWGKCSLSLKSYSANRNAIIKSKIQSWRTKKMSTRAKITSHAITNSRMTDHWCRSDVSNMWARIMFLIASLVIGFLLGNWYISMGKCLLASRWELWKSEHYWKTKIGKGEANQLWGQASSHNSGFQRQLSFFWKNGTFQILLQ